MNKWMLVAAMWLLGGGAPDAEPASEWTAHIRRPVSSAVLREGTLSFDARASAGDFTGTTRAVRGEMTGGDDMTAVRGWVEAPVRTLVTGNGRRDRDLNKSMESDKYPTIRFELKAVEVGEELADTTVASLHGTFLIHGVERDAAIPATIVFGGGGIRVLGTTPLNLKDYRIGGLTKAFGLLRMYDDILVHIDLTFAPAPDAAAQRSSDPAGLTY